MVLCRKLMDKQAIILSPCGVKKFLILFLSLLTISSKVFPDQENSNLITLPAEACQKLQLEGIQRSFRKFADKCVENKFYSQIRTSLTNLLSIIDHELKNNDSLTMVSSHSTEAMAEMFQIATLLATDTRNYYRHSLKIIYTPVSKVFGWNKSKKIEKKLFIYYWKEFYWNLAKDWIDGPFKLTVTFCGVLFVIPQMSKFIREAIENPKIIFLGKSKDDKKGELEKEYEDLKKLLREMNNKFNGKDN